MNDFITAFPAFIEQVKRDNPEYFQQIQAYVVATAEIEKLPAYLAYLDRLTEPPAVDDGVE